MYRLPKDTEIDLILLQNLLDEHRQEVNRRFKPLYDAYLSDHEILHNPAKPAYKPDNRIVVNFPKYIVDTMNGFFIGNPVKVIAEDAVVSEYVQYLRRYNNQDDTDASLSKISKIFGKAYEMYYADEEAELCTTYLTPIEAFMVFDDSIIERPLFFIRRYTDREGFEYGSISNARYVRNFKVTGGLKWLDEWQPHYFDGVPATEYVENDEKQGLFEPVMTDVNAYNKALSEKANDVDYFADAYLKILGQRLENEDVAFIRDTRILNLYGDDTDKFVAEFMEKPSNDAAQENLLNRLEKVIFQTSMVANISDENFGTSSGIALQYKLQNMRNLEKANERKFAIGMDRRFQLLFSHPSSKVPKDSWIQLEYKFTPNIPANLLEEAQIAAQMEGITSHETQLKVLSAVDNVQQELDRIEAENKAPEETIVDRIMFGRTEEGVE